MYVCLILIFRPMRLRSTNRLSFLSFNTKSSHWLGRRGGLTDSLLHTNRGLSWAWLPVAIPRPHYWPPGVRGLRWEALSGHNITANTQSRTNLSEKWPLWNSNIFIRADQHNAMLAWVMWGWHHAGVCHVLNLCWEHHCHCQHITICQGRCPPLHLSSSLQPSEQPSLQPPCSHGG